MLLPWGETTILAHEVTVWKSLGAIQVAVVIACDDAAIEDELDRSNFLRENRIINPDPSRGMFSSIQCAALWSHWNDALTHFALVLGDQPHLQTATLRSLIEFCARNPGEVCQPMFQGIARHPVLLPRAIFGKLATTTDATLRDFLHSLAGSIARVELDDPGLGLDIDRPEDYEQALRLSR